MTTQPAENGGATRCDLTAIRRELAYVRRHAMLCGPPDRSCFRPSCSCWCHSPSEASGVLMGRADIESLLTEVEALRGALSDITAFIDEEADVFSGYEWTPTAPLLAVLDRVGITA